MCMDQEYVGFNLDCVAVELQGLLFNDQQLVLGISQRDHQGGDNGIRQSS